MYYLQSRYYDPEVCRFINADEYASTGQGFIGCNMFAYCNNSPANCVDHGGNLPLRNTMLMVSDSGHNAEARAYINYKYLEEWKLENGHTSDEVTGNSVSVSGGWGLAGLVGLGRVYAPDGKPAITITIGLGGGLGLSFNDLKPSAGLGASRTVYNGADSVDDLSGWGVSIGTTLGFAGGELSAGGNVTGLSGSLSPSLGWEFHAVITYTWVIKLG